MDTKNKKTLFFLKKKTVGGTKKTQNEFLNFENSNSNLNNRYELIMRLIKESSIQNDNYEQLHDLLENTDVKYYLLSNEHDYNIFLEIIKLHNISLLK